MTLLTYEQLGISNEIKKHDLWMYTPLHEFLGKHFSETEEEETIEIECSKPTETLHLKSGQTGSYKKTYILIRIPENFKGALTIDQSAEKDALHHTTIRIEANTNSEYQVILLNSKHNEGWILNSIQIDAKENASLTLLPMTTGGKWMKNLISANHTYPHSQIKVYGLYVTREGGYSETQIDTIHSTGGTTDIFMKGIVAKKSEATFGGHITIEKEAKSSKANVMNKNILTDKTAKANSLPSFKINTSDVECKHGTSTGHLDDEQLFYMRARGINVKMAKQMLLEGYMKEVVDRIDNETIKKSIIDGALEALNSQ